MVDKDALQAKLRVAFILQPHFSLLAFTAAADALTTANLVIGKDRFQFQTLSLHGTLVESDLGIQIPCDHASAKAQLASSAVTNELLVQTDLLIVCGGYRCSREEDPTMTSLLHLATSHDIALGSLWNGVFCLAYAGLMEGFSCALHANDYAFAQRQFPRMDIRTDNMVIDRNRLSAAGPNSAFDLMLSLIQRHDSASTMQQIRRILKADTSTGEAVDVALRRDEEHRYPQILQNALQLMRSNMAEPVDKQLIARHINKSARAMERLFQQHLNTSPARHYLIMRLQRAHELLVRTDHSIAEISITCGFVSSAHFSRAFSNYYGRAPSKLRKAVSQMLDS